MEATKYISVPKATRRELEQIFGCSRVTVWSALNYRTDNGLAPRIRAAALAKGGTECNPGKQKIKNLNN